MHLDMQRAKRCGARTRADDPCQSPAMSNGRCRMHGGRSPGAPKGNRNAFKHGRYSADAIARRPEISRLVTAMKDTTRKIVEYGSLLNGVNDAGISTPGSSAICSQLIGPRRGLRHRQAWRSLRLPLRLRNASRQEFRRAPSHLWKNSSSPQIRRAATDVLAARG